MKVALLIHAHINPEQVARLVSRLQHPDVDIYINVDAKVDISEFKNSVHGAVFLTKRVEVRWGRFSQVQQILNSFEEISDKGTDYSHILFISGLDYPVKPIDEIVSFLKQNPDKSFIDHRLLGDDSWSKLMKKRYEYWYFLPETDLRSRELVKKVLEKVGFKRKYPFPNVYYGSCWFCLTMEAVKYLLDFTKQNPQIVDFFAHSGCSDELYIQSVLADSPLKNKLVNEIFRYIDWSDKGKSPKTLILDDFDKVSQSNVWFARKLDINVDTELFGKLDQLIGYSYQEPK